MFMGDKVRQALVQGRKQLAAWVNMESPIATEIMAGAGFDIIFIDQEHGPGNALSAITQQQAIRAGGDSAAFIRIHENNTQLIKRVLDTGVDGIMVPLVETAEDVAAVVAGCRLPPHGVRGTAPGNIRAANYGYQTDRFVESRGLDVFVMTQVETEKTVTNLNEIVQMDGVDLLFIGRNDLASSIGKLDDQQSTEALELLNEAEHRIKQAGRWMGGVPAAHDSPADMFERGYDLVVAGAEHALLRNAAVTLRKKYKPA